MFNNDWDEHLPDLVENKYKTLIENIHERYYTSECHPRTDRLFRAFQLTPLKWTKVVILGHDPHPDDRADGLALSSNPANKPPTNTSNFLLELNNDLGIVRTKQNLDDLARNGVLLLNQILSVEKGAPGSHEETGWVDFTDDVVKILSRHRSRKVFILLGNRVHGKERHIDQRLHLVIKVDCPSDQNGRFLGSKIFSKTNEFLKKWHARGILWG